MEEISPKHFGLYSSLFCFSQPKQASLVMNPVPERAFLLCALIFLTMNEFTIKFSYFF
mgnify:CR=1 FL=1